MLLILAKQIIRKKIWPEHKLLEWLMNNKTETDFNRNLVTIIIPTYNSEKFIEKTLSSVIQQSYPNFEVCIVDDASTDSTVNKIKKIMQEDSRINLTVNDKNSGAAITRNLALKQAKGRYVAFLDADDIWKPKKLEKQLKFMEENNYYFSFTAYQLIDEDGKKLNKYVDVNSKREVGYHDMLAKKATIGCSTVIIDQTKIGKLQMPLIRTGQDYALWLKILRNGNKAYRFPEVLTDYRIVPGSISRNKIKKAKRQWQIYRSLEKLGLIEAVWYFSNYAWRAVFRV